MMEATIVELRYKMKDVLRALRRNEKVRILYRGKEAGVIIPSCQRKKTKSVTGHPFFGRTQGRKDLKSVEQVMSDLRGERYRAV